MEIGKHVDLLILTVLSVLSGCYSIPLDQFFPFGDETEDILSNLSDDGSVAVQLGTGFVFYGTCYTTLYVSFTHTKLYIMIIIHPRSFIYMYVCMHITIIIIYIYI